VRLASPQQREDCSPEMSPERARQEIEQYKVRPAPAASPRDKSGQIPIL